MPQLPSGTLTFLFTDIEGSTRLWEVYPDAMRVALARHDALLRQAIEAHGGRVFKTVGDAFCAAFTNASDALNAATDAQRLLNHGEHGEHGERQERTTGDTGQASARRECRSVDTGILERQTEASHIGSPTNKSAGEQTPDTSPESFPVSPVIPVVESPFSVFSVPSVVQLSVRMALHSGVADERDGDYFGPPLNRVARLLAIGHGGQILLSQATHALLQHASPADLLLRGLGRHGLKDLGEEDIWQVLSPDLPADFPPLRSLSVLPTNLPLQLTSFVGREAERAEVKRRLADTRLLTLVGTGGTGKTRLALQASVETLEQYPEGVWLVELAPLADPALLPSTVLGALKLREIPRQTPLQTLTEHLKTRTLLLVLDNCEHLIQACAQLVDTLLRACPGLRVLATSREPLNVGGELLWRVPGLMLPPSTLFHPDAPHTYRDKNLPAALLEYDAVQLFVERALASRPDFHLDASQAVRVGRLCARLDGIPLALELAAARVRSVSLEQIESRLQERFRLLTGGSRAVLPRQQTLRALIDWSYDLLNGREKTLLRRLAVFAGGWTMEAAEQICADAEEEEAPAGQEAEEDPLSTYDILDVLQSLVDKSLVVFEESRDAPPRYRLLESIGQYARDRLHETTEEDSLRRRHRDFFVRLGTDADSKLQGPEQTQTLDLLETEHDNLRATLDFCLHDEPPEVEIGQRLSAALLLFWRMRGYLAEGRNLYAALLTHPRGQAGTEARGDALLGAGTLANLQGDYSESLAFYRESLALWRNLENKPGMANALSNLGILVHNQGDYPEARVLLEQALALQREQGNRRGMANALGNLGNVADAQGDNPKAQALYEESQALWRELGDKQGIASVLENLGNVACNRGDYLEGRKLYEQGLALQREMGNKGGMVIALNNLGDLYCEQNDAVNARRCLGECLRLCRDLGNKRIACCALDGYARLALHEQQPVRSVRLLGAAHRLREEICALLFPTDRDENERRLAQLRQILGEAPYEAAWKAGIEMTWEKTLEEALAEE